MALTFLLAPPSDTLGLVLKSPSKLNIVSFGWLEGGNWQLKPEKNERENAVTCRNQRGAVWGVKLPYAVCLGQIKRWERWNANESETYFFEIATFALGKEQSTMVSCKVLWASAYDSATIRCCALSLTLCDSKQPRRKQKHKTFIAGTSRHALMQL